MPPATSSRAEVERVRAIRSFPQLLEYLRDELDWPIEIDDVENLTFEYSPEELGLDTKTAVKIRHIRQLRPLASSQPWGIFFVEFEPKKLPVVVLRRVLQRLVIDRRGRAKSSERQAWKLHDLLFVSSFGENDERSLTFAHFADAPSGRQDDLPTLKVLGWDADDTVLHLDKVHRDLKEHLRWPADDKKADEWRRQWSKAFTLSHRYVITTSKDLALRLADLAMQIRTKANQVLRVESSTGPLRKLQKAFQEALIHDLDDDGFADLYAQTISYGLLSARIMEGPKATADSLADRIPITNPFLKELLQSFLKAGGRAGRSGKGGIDFDELGVSDIVDLLNSPTTNMEAVLRDFGNKNPLEDPVIHFYELFLKEYDPKKRMQRGVFYTPRPVVSFIVRSVHEILQKEFGLPDGLADTTTWGEMLTKHPGLKLPTREELQPGVKDPVEVPAVKPEDPFLVILDPATGTGTFLVETIEVIHSTLVTRWIRAGKSAAQIEELWNQYVPTHLLPRLHGYELMPASYAIAHMKLGLKLHETGYGFGSEERVRVFLTNALEPSSEFAESLTFAVPALNHEAHAVNDVKRNRRFTVTMGNPPYSQYSANLSDTAKTHIDKYRYANGHRIRARNALQLERNLNDDYVKFMGLCTTLICESGAGVLGMITNRMFLDSESLVGFRQRHCEEFSGTAVLDLHGDLEASRRIPALSGDQNVFQITQGVAITFLWRVPTSVARRSAGELIGSSEHKAAKLGMATHTSLAVDATEPAPVDWWLDAREIGQQVGMALTEVMPVYATLPASNRDHLVIDFDDKPLLERVRAVAAFRGTDEKLCEQFDITLKPGWRIADARRQLRAISDPSEWVVDIQYRPFDRRRIFLHPLWIWQYSPAVTRNLVGRTGNLVLVSLGRNRANTTNGFWVTSTVADKGVVSSRDNASGFPLYCYPEENSLSAGAGETANFSPRFVSVIEKATGLSFVPRGTGDLRRTFGPNDLLHYIYALLYSIGYRKHLAASLAAGFPRVLVPRTLAVFELCARRGADLVAVHLLKSPRLDRPIAAYTGPARPEVVLATFARDAVWLDKAQTRGFRGVPEAVWNFHIGGYQVCEKWLKDRKGRTLSKDDIEHYQKIIVALSETIRIMAEIDKVIDAHGGWPGAFVTDTKGAPVT